MSMREKSLERRRVTKEHNSNFRAGHVYVNENQLYKTGLRGRKRFLFYMILLVLYIIVVSNLLVLLLIMFSLKINDEGMAVMEVVPDRAIRFLHQLYMDKITLNGTTSAQLASFHSQNLDFFGEQINLQPQTNAHIGIGVKKTEIYSSSFEVVNPTNNKTVFPQQNFKVSNLNKVSFGLLNTSKVSSSTGNTLHLTSLGNLNISAGEDIDFKSNEMQLTSSSLTLHSKKNIYLKMFDGLFAENLATIEDGFNISKKTQLCISTNTGTLFRIHYNASCNNYDIDSEVR
ncbi:uncharacterized protein [Antedon mediterranea]|uniref:uncharacterized protein n=1 Tax=Antedon mediterranea TaxID=105859 RepID=UPI003AF73B22